MADLEADSVRGPKDNWKFNSPGYSVVLGICGKREGCMKVCTILGDDVAGVPGVETSLYVLDCRVKYLC